jgi:hypothetical protein
MPLPTPPIPNFTDGQLLNAAGLNALAANLNNLYNYNQAGFFGQRPCVIARQTTGQNIPNAVDTLLNFQTTNVNTDNMFVPSQPTQLTIQHAGIYYVYSQTRYGIVAAASLAYGWTASLLANGTSFANAIGTQGQIPPQVGNGTVVSGALVNLAAGATLYLNAWQSTGAIQTLGTDGGGSCLGAVFLTPSS